MAIVASESCHENATCFGVVFAAVRGGRCPVWSLVGLPGERRGTDSPLRVLPQGWPAVLPGWSWVQAQQSGPGDW